MATTFLLDTNICIFLLKDAFDLRRRILEIGFDKFAVSEITIAELYYGASKSSRKEERLKDVERIMQKFVVLPVFPVLPVYGDVKAELESKGEGLDDFDLLIGATALANNLVLVTNNTRHLGRIPGIMLEDWVKRE